MSVEQVAGSPWNQWPDVHGIGDRMAVESALKTEVNGNRLIESQGLSLEAVVLVKQANFAWLSLRDEIAEPQHFINSLHGLSSLNGVSRAAKLDELKERYEGTQIEKLLERLFG